MSDAVPKWKADVPEPESIVVYEDGKYRAELINYVQKAGRVKDIRVRGPVRDSRREARKDAHELRIAALKGGGTDPALFLVRARRKELESVTWKEEELKGGVNEEEDEKERKRLEKIEEEKAKEVKKKEDIDHATALARLSRQEGPSENFKPVAGVKWGRPGSMTSLPVIRDHPDNSWFIHERQDATGKYRAWLFFNSATGKYYRQKDSGVGFIQVGVPNDPREFPLNVHLGSANLTSKAGKKLDMAVLLPELHKTGFLLKQSLGFLDKPASLFVLCDGLRNSPAASEFCAKKLHTVLLPRLSARATEWEDFELVDVVRESAEALDKLLLDSPACLAGSCLAVGLLAGTRLVLGALGGVRCIVCKPPPAAQKLKSLAAAAAAKAPPWTARLVAGGDAHTAASEEERLRIESAGNRIFAEAVCPGGVAEITARSASTAELAALDERERILTQVIRGSNPFACLGIEAKDLRDGPGSIRKIFRKRSLVVHPDKVGEDLKARAVAVFAKLEAASSAVEAMLSADQAATMLLAEIDATQDSGKLTTSPAIAAKLLGVQEGTEEKAVKAAAEKKFRQPLGRLQQASRTDVERGMRALDLAEETILRGTQLWAPAASDEAVRVTRALGCKDLKTPVPLLTAGMAAECVELEPGACVGIALLSDGLRSVSDAEVARRLSQHYPARPRAAALRIALDSASRDPGEAVGIICGYFDFEGPQGPGGAAPAAKKAKTEKATRVRISHILLRWAGLKTEDQFARPGRPAPTRTQAAAERELLELLEELLAGDAKTLATRFKAQVLKLSECSSAQNVPYADLGWIERGEAELALEAAAFNAPVAGLSDVVISSRGAHLMYRLA